MRYAIVRSKLSKYTLEFRRMFLRERWKAWGKNFTSILILDFLRQRIPSVQARVLKLYDPRTRELGKIVRVKSAIVHRRLHYHFKYVYN